VTPTSTEEKIATLTTKVAVMEVEIERVEATVNTRIDNLEQNMNSKFEVVNKRFDNVDETLKDIKKILAVLDETYVRRDSVRHIVADSRLESDIIYVMNKDLPVKINEHLEHIGDKDRRRQKDKLSIMKGWHFIVFTIIAMLWRLFEMHQQQILNGIIK